jgi:hypothetical protein
MDAHATGLPFDIEGSAELSLDSAPHDARPNLVRSDDLTKRDAFQRRAPLAVDHNSAVAAVAENGRQRTGVTWFNRARQANLPTAGCVLASAETGGVCRNC